jgi:hypothetical protein
MLRTPGEVYSGRDPQTNQGDEVHQPSGLGAIDALVGSVEVRWTGRC